MIPRVLAALLLFSTITFAQQVAPTQPAPSRLQSSDIFKLRSVGDVRFSPDGRHISYIVENNDGPRRPYGQLYVMDVASGRTTRFCEGQEGCGGAEWSRDSQWIAFHGQQGEKSGIVIAHPDGSARRFLAEQDGTNAPVEPGRDLAWSPDGRQIAFVNAVPGPETQEASGDPVVIRRYLYKPDFFEGMSHFNDNRRLHIFLIDVTSGQVRQLTTGNGYEHSIDWSPNGGEIVYAAEHEPDSDQFFNTDLFTINARTGAMRQLTFTEGCEFTPVWSPDGRMIAYRATKRGITDRETNMEDTHLWVINADGSNSREVGGAIDNRQGPPQWSADSSALYFQVQERGNIKVVRLPVAGGSVQDVIADRGFVTSFSVERRGLVAYSFAGPEGPPDLWLGTAKSPKKLTELNADVLAGKQIASTESFTFLSNDNKWTVEAFLTLPLGLRPDQKYPMILNIHGGPHGEQGPLFNVHNQVYAAQGWAVLMVNYRGSTGYGQKFADAVFRDQDGDEGNDVLFAVSAAIRRYPWIDRDRLGIEGVSYGGQLTDWLITQTNMFKAAIPIAGITNLISYNYMTYYNQYEAMEWGAYPHQDDLMNIMWERSALKHVAAVHTPTMLMHGENDPDVPIAEAEQYFIALNDVGTEAVFVRYPREGHGLREPKHQADALDRSIDWYKRHFANVMPGSTAIVP